MWLFTVAMAAEPSGCWEVREAPPGAELVPGSIVCVEERRLVLACVGRPVDAWAVAWTKASATRWEATVEGMPVVVEATDAGLVLQDPRERDVLVRTDARAPDAPDPAVACAKASACLLAGKIDEVTPSSARRCEQTVATLRAVLTPVPEACR